MQNVGPLINDRHMPMLNTRCWRGGGRCQERLWSRWCQGLGRGLGEVERLNGRAAQPFFAAPSRSTDSFLHLPLDRSVRSTDIAAARSVNPLSTLRGRRHCAVQLRYCASSGSRICCVILDPFHSYTLRSLRIQGPLRPDLIPAGCNTRASGVAGDRWHQRHSSAA